MARQTVQRKATPKANTTPLLTPIANNSGVKAGSIAVSNAPLATDAPVVGTQSTTPIVGVQPIVTDFAKAAEMQWRIYQANSEWIRFADIKAGALLTANGVVLATILSALKNNADVVRASLAALILAVFSGAALLVSAGCCLSCINPKTTRFHATHDPKTASLLFFGHIAEFKTKEAYQAQAKALGSEEVVFEQVSQQVWMNARVSRKKHRQVTLAVWSLAASIALALLAVLVTSLR